MLLGYPTTLIVPCLWKPLQIKGFSTIASGFKKAFVTFLSEKLSWHRRVRPKSIFSACFIAAKHSLGNAVKLNFAFPDCCS